jgi:hypothetical protein
MQPLEDMLELKNSLQLHHFAVHVLQKQCLHLYQAAC